MSLLHLDYRSLASSGLVPDLQVAVRNAVREDLGLGIPVLSLIVDVQQASETTSASSSATAVSSFLAADESLPIESRSKEPSSPSRNTSLWNTSSRNTSSWLQNVSNNFSQLPAHLRDEVATNPVKKISFLRGNNTNVSVSRRLDTIDSVKVTATVSIPNAAWANAVASKLVSLHVFDDIEAAIDKIPGLAVIATGLIVVEGITVVRSEDGTPISSHTVFRQTSTKEPARTQSASGTTAQHMLPQPSTPRPLVEPFGEAEHLEEAENEEQISQVTATQRVLFGGLALLILVGLGPALSWVDIGGRPGWHRLGEEARDAGIRTSEPSSYRVHGSGRRSSVDTRKYTALQQDDQEDLRPPQRTHLKTYTVALADS
jgi:hypothetical protein